MIPVAVGIIQAPKNINIQSKGRNRKGFLT